MTVIGTGLWPFFSVKVRANGVRLALVAATSGQSALQALGSTRVCVCVCVYVLDANPD